MILSDREIKIEIDDGNLFFDPAVDDTQIGDASVDVRLGRSLRVPEPDAGVIIRPGSGRKRPELVGRPQSLGDNGYNLDPGKFVVGSTLEKIVLPNYLVGRLEGKSTLARLGLMDTRHVRPY